MKINIQHLKNSYPKIRPPLSKGITLFFDKYYKDNRENFILQLIESWLHRSIIGRRQKDKKVLEIGAGSLNHLKYENITVNTEYSIIEPKVFLYKNSLHKTKIHKFFSSIKDVPNNHYDRIISCATLEHLTNIAEFLVLSALKIKKTGFHSHSIPCVGYPAWEISSYLTSGILFKIKTGFSYGEIMRHEHINSFDEILSLIKYFYNKVEVKYSYPFFFSPYLAFYANITFSDPKTETCEEYLNFLASG